MKKVLIIEDNKSIRENIGEILELAGYEVLLAENGKKGVELALQRLPDIVICDIMMPELDGYGVLNILQRHAYLAAVPFIFLTAKAEAGDFRRGMGMGADDYITKPFSPTDLLQSVESRIRKAERLQQAPEGIDGLNNLLELSTGQPLPASILEGRPTESFRKKQIIYAEGNHAYRLFYVKKGRVKQFVINEEGKELVLELYAAGDFFGYNALFEGGNYRDNASALEATELVLIPKNDFESLIKNNYAIGQRFMKLLASNVAAREQHLLGLAYNSLRKKVAEALVTLYAKFASGEAENFALKISRENLAAVAGTATESLIRTLTDFKQEKIIDIDEGLITIRNLRKLREMVN